jgi:hypothetical protein
VAQILQAYKRRSRTAVNTRWPEDRALVAAPRPIAEPLDATLEFLEPKPPDTDDDPTQPLLLVLAIGVLVLIGALLFWLGPPTIFPPLDCGDCGVLGP